MSARVTAHAVFGRGGIRGIAMAGAVAAFEAAGYRFDRVAGVSAGGVVAALVAAGYTGEELRRVVCELDFAGWRDRRGSGRIPVLGPAINLLRRFGLYEGDALLRTLRRLLAERGIHRFGDLRDRRCERSARVYRLRVVAADVTRGRMIVLPDDAGRYGIDPDALEVALALRMSASLPFFFRPLTLGAGPAASLVVDGGLLAALPFALLDPPAAPAVPTFGIQAVTASATAAGHRIRGPASLLLASYHTALAANARWNLSRADAARTVEIDCHGIRATRFGLSATRRRVLYDTGVRAAERFLDGRERDDSRDRRLSAPAARPKLSLVR